VTDRDPVGTGDALADLHALEAELRDLTNDWTDAEVGFTADLADDRYEDLADERVIFEAHGYTQSVVRENGSVSAIYRKEAAADDDAPAILIRAYNLRRTRSTSPRTGTTQ
jgi:hypothetical protein